MKTDFYIYEHWRPDTNVCFYVGRGRRRRAYRFDQRNEHHARVVAKLHKQNLLVDVRIVVENLTDERADIAEIARIAFWRAVGVKLTNQTDGGDGCGGRVASEAQRQKMSAAMKGKPKSAEHRRNMSAAHKVKPLPVGLLLSKRMLGRKHKPESIEKIRLGNLGKIMGPLSRAKMSAARQGVKRGPHSAETRAKIAAAQKGKKLSSAHRVKLCVAQQARQDRARADSLAARQGLRNFSQEIDGRPAIIVES